MLKSIFLAALLMAPLMVRADIFDVNKEKAFHYTQSRLNNSLTQQFPFTDNLNEQIKNPFLQGQNPDELMRSVENSRMMLWQYSSPAAVDL